jgi:hypothetical protein
VWVVLAGQELYRHSLALAFIHQETPADRGGLAVVVLVGWDWQRFIGW